MGNEVRVRAVLPLFLVSDVKRSAEYYRDVLGFRICQQSGDPPSFAIVDRGDGRGIHLKEGRGSSNRQSVPDAWDAYFEVEGLAALHAELSGRGARILRGPVRTVYDMTEFEIEDCNGRVLCFGEASG
jgi:predicted enzyme related to lactoylglutathione lyase